MLVFPGVCICVCVCVCVCVCRGGRGRVFVLATVSELRPELRIKAGAIPGETSQQLLGGMEGKWERKKMEEKVEDVGAKKGGRKRFPPRASTWMTKKKKKKKKKKKNVAEGQAGEERAVGVGPRHSLQISFGCRD